MEATGNLIGNKIADKITIVSKTSRKNNSETNEEVIKKKNYRWLKTKVRKLLVT